jgi:hypothetical protein
MKPQPHPVVFLLEQYFQIEDAFEATDLPIALKWNIPQKVEL